MESEDPQFDYESYEKSLKVISELAEKDYWHQYTTINSHQVGVAKTYLWVSAALLGFYVAVFDRYSEMITTNGLTLVLSFLSMSTSVIAFGLCVYAIPGRKGYQLIPNASWGEFSLQSYEYLKSKKDNAHICILSQIVDQIDRAAVYNLKTNHARAKQLRIVSWVLISSFVITLVTASISLGNKCVELINSKPKGVCIMCKDNTANQGKNIEPNVPRPAGPLNTNNGPVITEDVNIAMDGHD